MAAPPRQLSNSLLTIALVSLLHLASALDDGGDAQTYIVHVKKKHSSAGAKTQSTKSYHKSFLPAGAQDSLIHSYQHAISGFSARLTAEQVEFMKDSAGFISASLARTYHPLTTRSPGFLGLNPSMGIWPHTGFGEKVIIGVIDSGLYHHHPSFNSTGMPPPPARWGGRCKPKHYCNNKVIGLRSFQWGRASASPIDSFGHGSHTASTAGGTFVSGVSIMGNAAGMASGVAPRAHLAAYKVCFNYACQNSDILAAIDAAIKDGVDVLSISLGISAPSITFYDDPLAAATFAAAKKGILTSMSAGNDGPSASTVVNDAPWILTVGASTIDRRIQAKVKLGNGSLFDGESVFQPMNFSSQKFYPLVYYGSGTQYCYNGSLAGFDIKGKIVLCDRDVSILPEQAQEVKDAGGAAMIMVNPEVNGYTHESYLVGLPSTSISFWDGQKIKAYIKSMSSPTATILFEGTMLGDLMAPTVSYFSSRGPSLQAPGISKPDIIGPGENILAAWSPLDPDNPGTTFYMASGTSMSCPHLSGVAALVKSAHPDWSAAAIKSAIMTTTYHVNANDTPILDEKLTPANLYATGAGHVNVTRAMDPGLVYDIPIYDYVRFLCGLGYTPLQVEMITQEHTNCSSRIYQGELNYPTFSVTLGHTTTFSRTIMNVDEPGSCYSVRVVEPVGVEVAVEPRRMCFESPNQKATYHVTFSRIKNSFHPDNDNASFAQGYLVWESKTKAVRSVIAVNFNG